MELKHQQQIAFERIVSFLENDTDSVFILKGYAGTGKTTLVKALTDYLQSNCKFFQLMAPTGRASKVLTEKTGLKATTIHRGIYDVCKFVVEKADNVEDIEFKYVFPLKATEMNNKICIVDEASMISSMDDQNILFLFGSNNLLDDLISYTDFTRNGKLILIGDPAQLPPVSDNTSKALECTTFEERAIKCQEYELTDVLRQDTNSVLFKDAMKVREILRLKQRNELDFEVDGNSVCEVVDGELVSYYCTANPTPQVNNSVIITYSNKEALLFNKEIKRFYFGTEHMCVDDVLQIVSNNYDKKHGYDLMNGDMVRVLDISSQPEIVKSFAYITKGTERVQTPISLVFRDVIIKDEAGNELQRKIVESMLTDDKPNLTFFEKQALFIRFKMTHPKLKPNTEEFNMALTDDPYLNAVQVKYGYAITCHKAQGGEWGTAFVNFRNAYMNNDCLRWIYTATTRAKNKLVGCKLPHVKVTSKLKVENIVRITNAPEGYDIHVCVGSDCSDKTPYHNEDSNIELRKKYWQVFNCLKGSKYNIVNVECKPYRECYTISDGKDSARFDTCYSGKYFFRLFVSNVSNGFASDVLRLINNTNNVMSEYKYTPSSPVASSIWSVISATLGKCKVQIVSVVEKLDQYYVQYNIKTSGRYAALKAFINKNGFVTYIVPMSNLGTQDSVLNNIVNELKSINV